MIREKSRGNQRRGFVAGMYFGPGSATAFVGWIEFLPSSKFKEFIPTRGTKSTVVSFVCLLIYGKFIWIKKNFSTITADKVSGGKSSFLWHLDFSWNTYLSTNKMELRNLFTRIGIVCSIGLVRVLLGEIEISECYGDGICAGKNRNGSVREYQL